MKLRLQYNHHTHNIGELYHAIMQKYVIYVARVKLVHQSDGMLHDNNFFNVFIQLRFKN